ncbi:MAG: hypothetical protein HFH93_06360 [Lachnospiraceae bacterium]|nr:hypothetical protein [Lachnospiraceae bacterium]
MDIWSILEYTASVTVIGLLIVLVKLVFYDKLDARWHYFIWLVLLARILVPVGVEAIPVPLSVFGQIPVGRWVEMARILAQNGKYNGLFEILGRVYLWGACALALFYLAMWIWLRVRVALAPGADEAVREYVDQVARKYGVPGCRDIRVCNSRTPYICGLMHPVLVLPAQGGLTGRACLERLNETDGKPPAEPVVDPSAVIGAESPQTEAGASAANAVLPGEQVILHELLHKRYGDVMVNLAVHAVRVVNWFNPFAWLLTGALLNDSEALCDQRVLEYCGEETARGYGELLICMGEGAGRNPVKIGTSNMASSYRNMKTRIRRIRDFRKVPKRIGLVTLCITLMLTVSAIGSAAGDMYRMEIPGVDSVDDLKKALLYARCYHAHTPYEAIYLFLRSCKESNTIYRMAVMPEKEIPRYGEFAEKWFLRQDITTWEGMSRGETDEYPAYFPTDSQGMLMNYRIYNLTCDEKQGSATVYAMPYGQQSGTGLEWRLEMTREEGWKVWLVQEAQTEVNGAYVPEPLLSGSALLGDFRIDLSAYNEGVFRQLEKAGPGLNWYQNDVVEEESYPQYFSLEYKCRNVTVSYLGEESLEGHTVKVLTTDLDNQEAGGNREYSAGARKSVGGNQDNTGAMDPAEYREELGRMAGEASKEGADAVTVESYGQYHSGGNASAVFDGGELAGGASRLVCGGGNGYSQPGCCWKKGDRTGVFVQIYIDGNLVEEGEVWSGNL